MKNVTMLKTMDLVFWEEAELLGVFDKVHHSEYIAKDHSCPKGKDVYLTYEKATKALRMRSRRERSKQVYKCNICGHFHLTSRDGEGRRKKKYSRNEVKEYLQTTRLMLADEKIMHTARILKSQRPQYKGYWQSRYRDMQLIKSA
jgi:hypothetical protein